MEMIPILIAGQMPWKQPGGQAPWGALLRTLLGLLCLLLATAGQDASSHPGEVCLWWLPPGPIVHYQPFRCPRRPDGLDGSFCCGTCPEPYCCDSEEDRLDQDECLEIWKMLYFVVSALVAERATLVPPLTDPKPRAAKLDWSLSKAELTGTVLSTLAWAAIGFLILSWIIYKCCGLVEICRRMWRGAKSHPPSSREMLFAITPSELLLRAIEESLSNLSATSLAMDGATVGPRGRRPPTPPVHGPEAATRAPLLSSGATSDAAAGGENPPELGAAGREKATYPPVPPAPGPISA